VGKGTPPVKDDPLLDGYNVKDRATQFSNYFKNMALYYKTENLMHPMGDDFHYVSARHIYKNLDKLINYINSHPEFNMQIFYSTPSEYFKNLKESGAQFTEKTDDFFPYADKNTAFWTGYFTSRPTYKGMIKEAGRYLQSIRTMLSLFLVGNLLPGRSYNEYASALWKLEEAIALSQHHDAITGFA